MVFSDSYDTSFGYVFLAVALKMQHRNYITKLLSVRKSKYDESKAWLHPDSDLAYLVKTNHIENIEDINKLTGSMIEIVLLYQVDSEGIPKTDKEGNKYLTFSLKKIENETVKTEAVKTENVENEVKCSHCGKIFSESDYIKHRMSL